jgi:putative FmdB family regulatory protein
MPLYEYDCRNHGVFELARPMEESAKGASCPWCQKEAPRILSAPSLRQMPRASRVAMERNEKSRHEPELVRKRATPSVGAQREPTFRPASGVRPWVLEHG